MHNTEHINMGGGLIQLVQHGYQDYLLIGEKIPTYYHHNVISQTTPIEQVEQVEPEDMIPTECVISKNNLFEKELEQNYI